MNVAVTFVTHAPSRTAIPLEPVQLTALDPNVVLEETSTKLSRFRILIRLFFFGRGDE